MNSRYDLTNQSFTLSPSFFLLLDSLIFACDLSLFLDGVFSPSHQADLGYMHYKDLHPSITCDVCKKLFNTPSSLERHRYLHKEFKHKCEKCGAMFPFASSMEAHMITHLKDTPHKCKATNCAKAFFNKGNLVKHAKTHTDEKFKCSLCEYENVDERNLKMLFMLYVTKII